jgi:hypothetical protein
MRFARGLGWLVIGAAIGGLVRPTPAHACSCRPGGPGHFYLGAGGKLPRDAVGIPYHEPEFLGRGDRSLPRLDPARVSLAIRDGGRDHPIDFTIFSREGLEFITPVDRMRPGQVYVVRVRARDPEWEQRNIDAGREGTLEVAAAVIVEDEPLPLAGATLTLSPRRKEDVEVAAGGGSCSVGIAADVAALTVVLPAALEPYRDYLTYQTRVDGKLWSPSASMCQFLAPGRAWTEAPGTDKLFAACAAKGEGLRPGVHKVEVELASPDGTRSFVTPGAELEVDCAAPPPAAVATATPVPAAAPAPAACACTTAAPAPALLVVVALLRRRRPRTG